MVKAVKCQICKQPFIARSPNAKYCPGCQKEAKRRADAEHEKRRQAARAALRNGTKIKKGGETKDGAIASQQAPTIKLVDAYCVGCTYLTVISCDATNQKACDYIGATNRCRPCPAGKGCTVKNTGKKKYDWRRGEGWI